MRVAVVRIPDGERDAAYERTSGVGSALVLSNEQRARDQAEQPDFLGYSEGLARVVLELLLEGRRPQAPRDEVPVEADSLKDRDGVGIVAAVRATTLAHEGRVVVSIRGAEISLESNRDLRAQGLEVRYRTLQLKGQLLARWHAVIRSPHRLVGDPKRSVGCKERRTSGNRKLGRPCCRERSSLRWRWRSHPLAYGSRSTRARRTWSRGSDPRNARES